MAHKTRPKKDQLTCLLVFFEYLNSVSAHYTIVWASISVSATSCKELPQTSIKCKVLALKGSWPGCPDSINSPAELN